MPSQRRVRLYGVLALVTIILLLYTTRAPHQTHASDFYTRTEQALQEREHAAAAKQRDTEGVHARLQAAEEQAKKSAEDKDKSGKIAIQGPGKKGVAGRVEIDAQDDKKVPGVAAQGGRSHEQTTMHKDETMEEHEAEMEMNTILKKSPVIIFSKSYCPYSKKAKHILLEKYRILPAPHVVELDLHPLGPKLQTLLAHMTGRRTVPNILLIGRSIGGGDEMEELDQTDTLTTKFKEIGGTRIRQVEYRDARPEIRRQRRP
ncbi:hypothetical protein ACEQ8H_004214 [Pleosporales sp. CAS-2024a]